MRFVLFVVLHVLALASAAGLKWNLNWLRQLEFGHADARENRRPDQRVGLLYHVFDRMNQVGNPGTACDTCKLSLSILKESLNQDSNILMPFFYGVCSADVPVDGPVAGLFRHICDNLHLYQSSTLNGGFSFLPDFANALKEMDPNGIDGNYLCHYMFSNACPRPETPTIDYTSYWPPKPPKKTTVERCNTTFNVLHVSDVHLSANYIENSVANCLGAMCCDEFSFQNPFESALPAPKFGHWRCDCPIALLQSAINDTSTRKESDYKFALFTGDMVDHNPVLISKEETIEEEEKTLRELKRYLGNIPVYPVLGNHDSYPYSQEASPTSEHSDRTGYNLEIMRYMWSEFGWVRDEASEQVKATHGGYALEPVPGLKIITLNSNYWYRWNFYNYIGMDDPDPSGIIKFLISELLDCEERGIKAWVQAHVPPGGLPDEALPPAASFLVATLERFSDVITGQFFGHTHLDEFSVLYGNNATRRDEASALNVAWIAPSITPYTDLNPGWRYYEVDSCTFEIMDAITVYADIEPGFGVPWKSAPDLNWQILYSAREKYGSLLGWPATEPLNGKFWHRVANEFLYDPDFSDTFVRRSYRNSSRSPECSDYDCRSERYCYSTSMTPDQVTECRKNLHTGERWKAGRHRITLSNDGPHNIHRRGDNDFSPHDNMLHGIPSFPMPRPNRFAGKLNAK